MTGAAGFRRPIPPSPIETYDIPHPAVPPGLDGLTILHITDLHVRRLRGPLSPLGRLRAALPTLSPDLILFTGDYMDHPGDESVACTELADLLDACAPRLGCFGIFGNHDTPRFRRAARQLPNITWLENRSITLDQGLRLLGASFPEDLLGASLRVGRHSVAAPGPSPGDDPTLSIQPRSGGQIVVGGASLGSPSPHDSEPRRGDTSPAPGAPHPAPASPHPAASFSLTLLHDPTQVFAAAELNLPLCFAGHTHGGQVRLSPSFAPHTSSDLPPHLASGLLRIRGTLCAVSRGLGEGVIELRINCRPHVPLYTLRQRPWPPGQSPRDIATLTQVRAW